MSSFHAVKVFVDGFDDLFTEIIREFIGGNDDAFHGYGADIFFLSRIGTLRYGDLGEVWILLLQLVHMFCIDIDQCCRFIGSQILDRCGREACDDDTDIDIAILQCISSFAEGEILYIDIIIGQTICTEDLTGIRFCARAGSTDSDLFALEVSDGFDAFVSGGDELDSFRIECSDTADVFYLVVLEHFLAVGCIVSDIILDESDVDGAVFQHIDIGYRCTGRLCGCIHAFDILVQQFSKRTAQWVIGTSRTTSSDVQKLFSAACRRTGIAAACDQSCTCDTKSTCHDHFLHCFFHNSRPPTSPPSGKHVLHEMNSTLMLS